MINGPARAMCYSDVYNQACTVLLLSSSLFIMLENAGKHGDVLLREISSNFLRPNSIEIFILFFAVKYLFPGYSRITQVNFEPKPEDLPNDSKTV